MRILVTGDTGFIGSHMKEFLLRKGIEVKGYSRRGGFDVLNRKQLQDAAKGCDFIYHFAAEAKPGPSVLRPVHTIMVNLRGSLNVLEVCKEHGISLVYPSSCEIYGDSKQPITEDHPLFPPNPYAASKAAIDRLCYMYYKCYGVDVKIVRLFNPYGPRQQLNKIIPTFYFSAIKNKPLTVYGDGTDMRDFVYVGDIIRGLWKARKLPPGEAVNIATGKGTTNLEVAKLILKMVKSDAEIRFVDYPKAFGGIRWQIGSNKKARELIGWKPRVKLEDGIKLTIKWLETLSGGREVG
ncbi:MAG: NAD-dependent epimerase/dehydratase family protein [Candidatus Hadarchaeales archaeon]